MNHKNNKGFTLIELLVVVAIISLLSSITLASLQEARKKAIDAKIMQEYNQLKIALEIYYNENGRYPEPSPKGNYCISNTGNCKLAGTTIALLLKNFTTPAFTYSPSSAYAIGNNQGFIYQYFSPQKIIFGTNKTGVVNATVGIWTLSVGTGSNN
jgi:prepilin-type N-terminal cleavage/methylation domain-containing protein